MKLSFTCLNIIAHDRWIIKFNQYYTAYIDKLKILLSIHLSLRVLNRIVVFVRRKGGEQLNIQERISPVTVYIESI